MQTQSAQLNRVFFALSEPTRRALLRRLEAGPATVSRLASQFDVTLPAISKHLRVLADADLVVLEVSAEDRRAKVCSLNARGLDEAERWITENRAIWNRRLDALETLLERDARDTAPPKRRKR